MRSDQISNTLSEVEKTKIISSVYSNVNKLKIATLVYKLKEASADELSLQIGIAANRATMILKEMKEAGVMKTRRESHYIYYSLTEFGEKIVTLFN